MRNSKERIEEQIKKKTQTSELKKLQLGLDTKNTLWTEKKKMVCRRKRVQRRASQDRVQELYNILSHFSKWAVSIPETGRQSELKEIMHTNRLPLRQGWNWFKRGSQVQKQEPTDAHWTTARMQSCSGG